MFGGTAYRSCVHQDRCWRGTCSYGGANDNTRSTAWLCTRPSVPSLSSGRRTGWDAKGGNLRLQSTWFTFRGAWGQNNNMNEEENTKQAAVCTTQTPRTFANMKNLVSSVVIPYLRLSSPSFFSSLFPAFRPLFRSLISAYQGYKRLDILQ